MVVEVREADYHAKSPYCVGGTPTSARLPPCPPSGRDRIALEGRIRQNADRYPDVRDGLTQSGLAFRHFHGRHMAAFGGYADMGTAEV